MSNKTNKSAMLSLEALLSLTLLTIFAIPIIQLSNQFASLSKEIDETIYMNKYLYQSVISKENIHTSTEYKMNISKNYAKIQKKGKTIEIKKTSTSVHID